MSYKLGKPITNSTEDILSRNKFAISIANSINEYNESDMIALGLNGGWGTGKSSTINLIKENIDKEKYEIIEFNPWYYSSRKQLITDFFEQLSLIMGKNNENNELAKTLKKYGKLLSTTSIIPLPQLAFLKILGETAQGFGDFIGQQETDANENISVVKDKLNSELETFGKKILVIIDEIDRLEIPDIKEIFQLVRALGDLSNIVYFLSYDIEVIQKAFYDKKKYIDKIINIQFDIPKANSEDFFNYLKNEIENNYSKEIERIRKINYEEIMEVIREIGFDNLREVNKLINFFKITYKPIKENVNFGDYLLLCFLRCQKPTYYETVYINKDRLSSSNVKDDENLRKVIKAFEKNKKESKSYKRLIDDKYCNTYFEYNFRNGNISAEALLSKDYRNIQNNLENYDYLVNFVKNFDEILLRLDEEDIKFYLRVMMNKLSTLKKESSNNQTKETLQTIMSLDIIRLIKRCEKNFIIELLKEQEISNHLELKAILNIYEEVKKSFKTKPLKDNIINDKLEEYLGQIDFNYEIFQSLKKINNLGFDTKTYIETLLKNESEIIKILKYIVRDQPVQVEEDEYEIEYTFFMEDIPKEKYLSSSIIEERIKILSSKIKEENSQLITSFENRTWEHEENQRQYEQEEYFENFGRD